MNKKAVQSPNALYSMINPFAIEGSPRAPIANLAELNLVHELDAGGFMDYGFLSYTNAGLSINGSTNVNLFNTAAEINTNRFVPWITNEFTTAAAGIVIGLRLIDNRSGTAYLFWRLQTTVANEQHQFDRGFLIPVNFYLNIQYDNGGVGDSVIIHSYAVTSQRGARCPIW